MENTEGYVRLATAIVRQAARDYREAYLNSLARGYMTDEAKELKAWFTSSWGQNLSFGQGESIAKEVEEDCKMRYSHGRKAVYRMIEYNDEVRSLSEWANSIGLKDRVIRGRLTAGWSVEEAFTIPVGGKRVGK